MISFWAVVVDKNLQKTFLELLTPISENSRKTKHDPTPVNDAIGNAEAFLHLNSVYKLGIL